MRKGLAMCLGRVIPIIKELEQLDKDIQTLENRRLLSEPERGLLECKKTYRRALQAVHEILFAENDDVSRGKRSYYDVLITMFDGSVHVVSDVCAKNPTSALEYVLHHSIPPVKPHQRFEVRWSLSVNENEGE
jgi:hypothetical protein